MRLLACVLVGLVAVPRVAVAQDRTAERLTAALKAAGVDVVSVSIGDTAVRATWTVQPSTLQGAAQPTIDAFDVNDPAHATAELNALVTSALDTERLTSAVVWTILKQMYPMDTDAQTKTKYGVARTRIIDAFRVQPWK